MHRHHLPGRGELDTRLGGWNHSTRARVLYTAYYILAYRRRRDDGESPEVEIDLGAAAHDQRARSSANDRAIRLGTSVPRLAGPSGSAWLTSSSIPR